MDAFLLFKSNIDGSLGIQVGSHKFHITSGTPDTSHGWCMEHNSYQCDLTEDERLAFSDPIDMIEPA